MASDSPDASSAPPPRIAVCVVTACYNEGEILRELCRRTLAGLEKAGVDGHLVVVDDGSDDDSPDVLAELAAADPRIGYLQLSRNFGHQAAMSAGLDHAAGDAVILMDGDLQDPPELIPDLVARYREGYDVVYGVRESRDEAAWKRGAYRSFYRLLATLADVDIPPDSGDFGLMSRRVVEVVRASRERHRFVRGLRRWAGFRQTGLAYHRPSRPAGAPKYTLRKLIRLGMDGLFAFSSAPLRLATLLGVVTVLGAVGYGVYNVVKWYVVGPHPPGWSSLAAVILGMGGIQLIVLGVIGEYIGRIYDEAKGRPVYVVARTANVGAPAPEESSGIRVASLDRG